jgi:hypothetical protein
MANDVFRLRSILSWISFLYASTIISMAGKPGIFVKKPRSSINFNVYLTLIMMHSYHFEGVYCEPISDTMAFAVFVKWNSFQINRKAYAFIPGIDLYVYV